MSNVLVAKERTKAQGSTLRNLRTSGEIPAVVYGNKNGNEAISINNTEFLKVIKEVGRNGVISLDLKGKKQNVMLTDFQKDPLKNEIFHADFLILDMSAEMHAQVHINLIGDAEGVKDGGVLQQSLHELNITAKPNDIPEVIEIDVANLTVGHTITVGDIKGKYSVTIAHDDEEVIASILAPRQEEEISTGEQQDGGIPENQEGRETKANPES